MLIARVSTAASACGFRPSAAATSSREKYARRRHSSDYTLTVSVTGNALPVLSQKANALVPGWQITFGGDEHFDIPELLVLGG